uniref:Ninjurin 1 n=1 Tax=Marmota marmota marmota TaxID=9994 RepID=A0A8C5Z000_MARMA
PGPLLSLNLLPPRWGRRNQPINMNHYANKKSAAESMLDIALLMANASQLKAVVEQGPSFAFFVPLVVLISISLALQISVGVLLIFLGRSLKATLVMWGLDVRPRRSELDSPTDMQQVRGWAGWRGQQWPLSQDIRERQGDSPPFADAPADLFPMGPSQVALVTAASSIS